MPTPYQRFYEAIKSPHTRPAYEKYLKDFFVHSKTDADGIVKLKQQDIDNIGLINQEFLDAERERPGPLYPMYYECDFYNSVIHDTNQNISSMQIMERICDIEM